MSQNRPIPPSDVADMNGINTEQWQRLKQILFSGEELAILESTRTRATTEDSSLNELRSLLFPQEELQHAILQADYHKLQTLLAWLEKNQQDAEKLAHLLPKALEDLTQNSARFSEILAPQVEKTLQLSVDRNPQPLIDSLFPIIGPMIRKAISESLNDMLRNINQLVDDSLSINSIRWRLEARRTGKSYAEVALLRSLDYQVDQIFLIHQETSILLKHLTSPNSVHKDADMVSGMLSAVQDFVTDAFSISDGSYLSEVKLGDFTLLLEKGPKASLVAAVLGKPPTSLRLELQKKLETLHRDYQDELSDFKGDTQVFDSAIYELSSCLVRQKRQARQKKKPVLRWLIILILLSSLIGYSGYSSWIAYQQNQAWSSMVTELQQQPGIVIIEHDFKQLQGLVDPLIGDVHQYVLQQNLAATTLNLDTVYWQFKPYISLDPVMIERRIKSRLQLPAEMQYHYDNHILSLSGKTTPAWLQSNIPMIYGIQGINQVDTLSLVVKAIEKVDLNKARQTLQQAIQALESVILYFPIGQPTLSPYQLTILAGLESRFKSLSASADKLNLNIELTLTGFIDQSSGSRTRNVWLAETRTNTVLEQLKRLTQNTKIKFITELQDSTLELSNLMPDTSRRVSLNVKVIPSL